MANYYKVAAPVAVGGVWSSISNFLVGAPQTAEQKAKAAAAKQASLLAKAAELHAQNVAVAQQFAAVAKQKQVVIIAGGVTLGLVALALSRKKAK